MSFNKLYRNAILGIGCTVALSSCGDNPNNTGLEFAPNMYWSVGYEPFRQIEANPINPMGLNMRHPVDGTVARSSYNTAFAKGDSTAIDVMEYNIPKDSIAIADRTLTNPVPLTEQNLAEGKILYERYCQHCHGEGGAGNGTVGVVYKGVPNYKADAYKDMSDGHIFHVITHGKGRMWPHGSQVDPMERWKIVHYVHQLQKE